MYCIFTSSIIQYPNIFQNVVFLHKRRLLHLCLDSANGMELTFSDRQQHFANLVMFSAERREREYTGICTDRTDPVMCYTANLLPVGRLCSHTLDSSLLCLPHVRELTFDTIYI